MSRTRSELLFEEFCELNRLSWSRVKEGAASTPDYLVRLPSGLVYFEVKQIDNDPDFKRPDGSRSRTVGDHVRKKIDSGKAQMQAARDAGAPSVLLIYNNLDPLQIFGTEPHDFIAAMYGEMTVAIRHGRIENSYHSRNARLRLNHNSSFSAVGHLRRLDSGPAVEMYENIYARHSLNEVCIPDCFGLIGVEVVASDA